jgi:hypothetical protein
MIFYEYLTMYFGWFVLLGLSRFFITLICDDFKVEEND